MDIDTSTTALITGANGGIGQAIARELHQAGVKLVLSARRLDAVRGIAEELGAKVVLADLADRSSLARLVDEAGPIDVLVANAALPASGSLLDFSIDEVDAALDVNLRAPVVLSRLLAPGLAERGRDEVHVQFVKIEIVLCLLRSVPRRTIDNQMLLPFKNIRMVGVHILQPHLSVLSRRSAATRQVVDECQIWSVDNAKSMIIILADRRAREQRRRPAKPIGHERSVDDNLVTNILLKHARLAAARRA